LPIGISGTEIPKYPILSVLSHFGIPPFGISRYVKTRGLAPRFPGSRKLRVIKTLNMLLYFGVSSIGISLIGVSRLANSWGPHLGTPGAEIPKYNHFSTLYSFGVSQVGISGLASTRETYPWVFRVPKHRNAEPSHAMPIRDSASRGFVYRNFGYKRSKIHTPRLPECRKADTPAHHTLDQFRGFASRGFGTCEYKEILPWVFRVPKHRKVLTHPYVVISGFPGCESGFRVLRVQGELALDTPGAEKPKRLPAATCTLQLDGPGTPMGLGIDGPDFFATYEG
jgi:hypothetical protein